VAVLRRLGARRVVLCPNATELQAPGQDVIMLSARDDLFANWLAENEATAAVIRPDRYVYGVAGTTPDLARLVRNLEDALCR
jgi:3-(3-hydroxy-phenyl)propionate hydroxylase